MSYGNIEIKSTSKFLRIESGTPHDLRLLNETPSEKVIHGFGKEALLCNGEDCPQCEEGDEPKQRFSTNVYDHLLKRVMIWEFGGGIAKQLKAIDGTLSEENKKIIDIDLKVEAEGSGQTKKYRVTPRMTSKPVPTDLKLHDLGGEDISF